MSKSEAYKMKDVIDEGNALSDISNEASEILTQTKKEVSVAPTNQWLQLSAGIQGTMTQAARLVNNQGFIQLRKMLK